MHIAIAQVDQVGWQEYREEPHSNPTSPAEQFERINHNFWFPKDINVNEDILESVSSLLSN